MKDVFLGFLAQTLNKPVEEISQLLYKKGEDGSLTDELVDNAAELLKGLDVERVKTLRATADNKKALEDQRKRGYKEAREELEAEIKKAYNLESDKIGLELVREAVATEAKSDLPDDKVKRHPLYLDLEKRLNTEVSKLTEQHKAEREELEQGYARKFTLANVKQRALMELEKLNPVLPENASIAANYKRLYADAFEQFNYEQQEDGSFLVVKGDKRLEDDHGNPVSFEKLVKNTASDFFTFKEQSAKGSAGNKNGSSGSGDSTGSIDIPTDADEAWEKYQNAKTPEERQAIAKAIKETWGES